MNDLDSRGTVSLEKDKKAYQNINAVLRGRATKSMRSYKVNNRELENMSVRGLKELERRIGCNPDDLDAIDTLWEVQTLRFEHAGNSGLFDAEKNMGMITAGESTPNP